MIANYSKLDKIVYRRPTSEEDFDRIAELHNRHTYSALKQSGLSDDEIEYRGFLSISFQSTTFKNINAKLAVIMAEKINDDGKSELLGYVCADLFDILNGPKLHQEIFTTLNENNIKIDGNKLNVDNTFFYGPICIDNQKASKGVFKGLVYHLLKELPKQFVYCAFFISKVNEKSRSAHIGGLGIPVVASFFSNSLQKEFDVLAASVDKINAFPSEH